jgi:hypothetical protein
MRKKKSFKTLTSPGQGQGERQEQGDHGQDLE